MMSNQFLNAKFLALAGTVVALFILIPRTFGVNETWISGTLERAHMRLIGHDQMGNDAVTNIDADDQSDVQGRWPPIPNIMHFVAILSDADAELEFTFRHFFSIYSAYYWLQPEIIYIHTDASDEKIKTAKEKEGWTGRLLELPSVVVHQDMTTPYVAGNGVHIQGPVHRSDFTRMKAIIDFGGIYFDFDVYAFKDFKPLREMGFANVFGLEVTGGPPGSLNNGVLMAVKGSALMRTFQRAAHVVYDGGWVTASVILLTAVCRRLSVIPYEVMIMEAEAFHPHMTLDAGLAHMVFDVHPETPIEDVEPRNLSTANGDELWDTKGQGLADWQWDGRENPNELYSSAYATHGFKNAAVPYSTEFNVDYLLSRQSNFARKAYPAIKDALDKGWVKRGE